jgi:hypothetical protein
MVTAGIQEFSRAMVKLAEKEELQITREIVTVI